MRFLICVALIVAVVSAADRTWKQVKSCMEETAQSCTEKCKPEGGGQGPFGPFPFEKFITCMKDTRQGAHETIKSCLKENSVDVDKVEASACWKPEDPESQFKDLKENIPERGPPAIKKLIECAKGCMKEAADKCFEGCTGTEDKTVSAALKVCMPKAFEAAKPQMKQCMRGSGGPPLPPSP